MSTPYLGQINMFGGNYAQRGFAMCNGQLISIAQNTALYSLLGTTYGGDGVQTFGLPDLRSRLPLDWGQGPGLSNYVLGQRGGQETVTLTQSQIPAHTHTMYATTANASSNTPSGVPATPTQGSPLEFYAHNVSGQPPVVPQAFASAAVSMTGSSQPHDNQMPSLCVTFVIALQGIYPSRT
jgi:microcystin-dependent protein